MRLERGRYRYTSKVYSKYDEKQLKSLVQENHKTVYTTFSTSKHGTFSKKMEGGECFNASTASLS